MLYIAVTQKKNTRKMLFNEIQDCIYCYLDLSGINHCQNDSINWGEQNYSTIMTNRVDVGTDSISITMSLARCGNLLCCNQLSAIKKNNEWAIKRNSLTINLTQEIFIFSVF